MKDPKNNNERGHFHSLLFPHFYYQRATMCHREREREKLARFHILNSFDYCSGAVSRPYFIENFIPKLNTINYREITTFSLSLSFSALTQLIFNGFEYLHETLIWGRKTFAPGGVGLSINCMLFNIKCV